MAKVRYQPLGPLLSGEGSRAFLGLEIQNEERAHPVVLVWLPAESLNDPELLARLGRETQHAASLEHPNIIRVHGLAQLDEGIARVVEFADGESLGRILQACRQLPPRYAAKVVADAATGVHYAHVAGNDDGTPLIHGYLSPDTIIVSHSGAVKVAGYGALLLPPPPSVIRSYMAPEQVIAGREATTRQTDVFLLGMMLYECLTGDAPFSHQEDFPSAVLNAPLPPILSEEINQALRDVVTTATAKRAAERFPSALALRESLEVAVGPLPSNDELSAYLLDFFPDNEQARAARRREIDAGIADFARRQWELNEVRAKEAALESAAVISHAEEDSPAPRSRPPGPSTQGGQAYPEETEELDDEEGAPPAGGRSRALVWIIGLAVVTGLVAGGYLALGRRTSPPAPAPPAVAPPPVEVPRPEPAPQPAPMPVPVAEPADAGSTSSPPEPQSLATVEIIIEPPVKLVIGKESVGRSPFRGELKPGEHEVKLLDEKRGIRTTRTIVVKAEGKTRERIVLKKGYVRINAPRGAMIYLDGKRIGRAPRPELSMFEGRHRLVVTVGKAKWQQSFTIRPNERLRFDVDKK